MSSNRENFDDRSDAIDAGKCRMTMPLAISKRVFARWTLAGPVTLIAAVLMMASGPLWFPGGAAGIDNMVLPLVLFPAFWAIFFFYSLIEENLLRAALLMGAVILINAIVIYLQFA